MLSMFDGASLLVGMFILTCWDYYATDTIERNEHISLATTL